MTLNFSRYSRISAPPSRPPAPMIAIFIYKTDIGRRKALFFLEASSNGKFSLAVVHKFDLDNRNINTVPRAQATVATRIDCRCTNEWFRRDLPENCDAVSNSIPVARRKNQSRSDGRVRACRSQMKLSCAACPVYREWP